MDTSGLKAFREHLDTAVRANDHEAMHSMAARLDALIAELESSDSKSSKASSSSSGSDSKSSDTKSSTDTKSSSDTKAGMRA